jgi:hypothetical protein
MRIDDKLLRQDSLLTDSIDRRNSSIVRTERCELTSDSHGLDLYVEKTSSTSPTCLRVTTSITVNTMKDTTVLDKFLVVNRGE